jgi:hypothetical protein
LLCLFGQSLFGGTCLEGTPKAALFFSNGISDGEVTQVDTENSAKLVRAYLKRDRPTAFNYDCLRVAAAHNEGEAWAVQLFEAFLQSQVQNPYRFWRWLAGLELAPESFARLFSTLAANVNNHAYVRDTDLQNQIAQYTAAIGQGEKVIVVAHSQGNFYANSSYASLCGGQSPLTDFLLLVLPHPPLK